MDEFDAIMEKYGNRPLRKHFETIDEINKFALQFYRDAAEIYDCFTRVKNHERNPSGYSLDDAPIIGLLVRIWKLLKETIRYHVENNAEFIAIFQRTLLETAVTATYLLQHDATVLEDFRKCSYRDRLRILRDAKNGSAFSKTKAGRRLLRSVEKKMRLEGFSENDFEEQKRNKWKLQGKSFLDIFTEVYSGESTAQRSEQMYRCSFGIMSESVHCSWNDSMDWCLQRNEDGTFSIYPFFHPADIRYITPLLPFCNEPYALWLKRIEADDRYYTMFLDWIAKQNWNLYQEFDRLYGDMEPAAEQWQVQATSENAKNINALLQIFTDPIEWDKAKWSGTIFLFDPEGLKKQIPGLGIGFADFEAGKKIFDGWIKRVGHVDQFEEIRVSIIEGPLPGKPNGYTVMISSNPDHTIRRTQQSQPEFQPTNVILMSRMHRMNPAPSSKNLERFKQVLNEFGFYRLFPAHVANQQIQDMDVSLYIEKREIHFVQIADIHPNDPEHAIFAKNDTN